MPSLKEKHKHLRNLVKGFRLDRDAAEALVWDVAKELWYRLDTPTSLGLYLCAKYGDFVSVLKHKVKVKDYTDAESYALDYQACSLLQKCVLSVVSSTERESAALAKFREAEQMCRETNARFRSRWKSLVSTGDVEAVLFAAQRKIFSWIGEGPNPHEWASRCRFGPGSDDLSKGHRVGSYHKLSALSSTSDFADGALSLALDHPAWGRSLVGCDPFDVFEGVATVKQQIAPGNRVVFVPKTALIERSIAVEPRMNVYAQLGLGSYLRALLKTRAGLDLDTQSPNQEMAFDASVHGHLATIDLSMASDTIAIELVRDLLPPGWFIALDWCRSKYGIDPETSQRFFYEKFSSMGNGFTFELESMIFYALVQACCERKGVVKHYSRAFGDDIVCPVDVVDLLGEVLSYCGFRVNSEKSFSSGVFRESCGADFFDGTNVRPYFCKEVPTDVKALYGLANGIRRAGHRVGHGLFCDHRFRPAWLRTVRRIPEPLRALRSVALIKRRPWGLDIEAGDGGLVGNSDEFLSSPLTRYNREWQEGFYFGTLVDRAWQERGLINPSVLYAYALYRCKDGLDDDISPGVVTGRGVVGHRLNLRAYTRSLDELGPWL